MSNFENICCKVLGIILFLLVIILSVQLIGCTSSSNGAIKITPKEEPHDTIRDYPLLDHRGVLHKYRDNFESIIFPKHNKKLTQYCGTHFQWESIKAVYKREGNSDYRWYYIVSKNKKQ